jgi:protein-tyrosine-phosphatase
MGLRYGILRIWKDPVWSKVIAVVILSAISSIYFQLNPYLSGLSLLFKISLIIGISLLLLIAFLIFRFLKKTSKSKIIIYLSSGGTCRDPMAKAITLKLLEKKKIGIKTDIRGMALIGISSNNVSHAAINAIAELIGKDYILNHKPQEITEELANQADLILVMSRELLKVFGKKFPNHNKNNVYVFKEFFGLEGDISDPYPDGCDEIALNRYRDCALEMRKILSENLDKLINAIKI